MTTIHPFGDISPIDQLRREYMHHLIVNCEKALEANDPPFVHAILVNIAATIGSYIIGGTQCSE